MSMQRLEVRIPSDGLILAGDLRIPDATHRPGPALVFTGPLTGVKEQVTGRYAAELADRGYVTLAFDHRNFGESSGSPRQHEDPSGKIRDLLDATTFLVHHPAVDPARVGSVGVCLGTSYAVNHAAIDPRVRALGLVAGAYNDPRRMRTDMGIESYRRLLLEAAHLDEAVAGGADVTYLPAVAADGGPAAMPGEEPFAYYGTDRASSPGWVNRVTQSSIRELITLDTDAAIALLERTPTVVVHGRTDAYCSPDRAREVADRLTGPKDLLWLDTTNHIELYDDPAFVSPAVDRLARWLDQHLGG